MIDSLLYSETTEHLANLDHCGSNELRRAYLAIVLATLRSGYVANPRPSGNIRELQVRDGHGAQHFAVTVDRESLLFYLRQPALRSDPHLASEARKRFTERMLDEPNSGNEISIPIRSERDADDIAEWLFATP